MNQTPVAALRVIKKLAPTQPGALKLHERFGEALVCVRHRTDANRTMRITTVELVVDSGPIHKRDAMVGVRIDLQESRLQAKARNEGARWDPQARVWRMPRSVAEALDLESRIVQK